MDTHQSTTIPRARGIRAHQPTTAAAARVSASPPPERRTTATPLDRTSPESRTHILGQMIDGIAFIETACAALEPNDKTAFAMPCLHQGISMLRHAHEALERVDAEPLLRANRRRARGRRNERRAP